MKHIRALSYQLLILVGFSISLAGCGSDSKSDAERAATACATSQLAGSWILPGNTVTFAPNCTMHDTACEIDATTGYAALKKGSIILQVHSTNGKIGCITQGLFDCAYDVQAGTLSYSCEPI